MGNMTEKTQTNLSALSALLGEENVEEVKRRIGDLIVARVAEDMQAYGEYLFYPGDYEENIREAFEKVEKKISKMYSDAMLETAQEAVNRFKDISIASLNGTQGLVLRQCHNCVHKKFNRCTFYDDYYWHAHNTLCSEEGFINFEKKGDVS